MRALRKFFVILGLLNISATTAYAETETDHAVLLESLNFKSVLITSSEEVPAINAWIASDAASDPVLVYEQTCEEEKCLIIRTFTGVSVTVDPSEIGLLSLACSTIMAEFQKANVENVEGSTILACIPTEKTTDEKNTKFLTRTTAIDFAMNDESNGGAMLITNLESGSPIVSQEFEFVKE